MRSRVGHSNLRWGDVELKLETSGQKCMEFTERATKTRNGVVGGSRPYAPKMYEEKDNPRCPVALYEFYAEKRPQTMLKQEDPIYLELHRNWAEKNVWYVSQALGKNSLGCLVKTMCTEAGIAGRKVNHSARKTAITALVHEGVPPTLIQQHSGHKNLASINNYSTASIQQQKHISSVMCKLSSTTESRESDTLLQGDETLQNENFQQKKSTTQILINFKSH
ncbi:uncharacterized protein LOC133199852 [Saccostrea echinata]|uniref:uncharacterized protein LOC133199852 n=1 Tax=Saccostrea echinata TaxID=191078 RepID=UPI002A8388D7|nr:uncharacterized protein LOC133199852 [Saccostrea echinata]